MSSGIIIQRNAILLVAATDPAIYNFLSPATKARVDAIDARDPLSRTQEDIDHLLIALQEGCKC